MKPLGVSDASLMQSIQAPSPNFCPGCKMTNSSFSWRHLGSKKKAVVLYVAFFFFVVQVHSLLLHVVSGLSLQIYITCFLKASAASVQVNEDHKACSFKANG